MALSHHNNHSRRRRSHFLALLCALPAANTQAFRSSLWFRKEGTSHHSFVQAEAARKEPFVSDRHALEHLANRLKNQEFKNIVVLVGAGASTSAGIPDFRTPGTGLYSTMQEYNLPFPEAVFDLSYFRQNPKPFVELCSSSLWPRGEFLPTPSHHFLRLLQEKEMLLRVYTQNIDGLETMAGVEIDKLVECHGHFRSASCSSCGADADVNECMDSMVHQHQAPKCKVCGEGLIKPDVVFFGEELPARFQDYIYKDVEQCDLLIVIGTSLLVMPVAGIPQWVSKKCPRLLLNRELVGDFVWSQDHNRDVFCQGDCDVSVATLCEMADWQHQFEQLIKQVQ